MLINYQINKGVINSINRYLNFRPCRFILVFLCFLTTRTCYLFIFCITDIISSSFLLNNKSIYSHSYRLFADQTQSICRLLQAIRRLAVGFCRVAVGFCRVAVGFCRVAVGFCRVAVDFCRFILDIIPVKEKDLFRSYKQRINPCTRGL